MASNILNSFDQPQTMIAKFPPLTNHFQLNWPLNIHTPMKDMGNLYMQTLNVWSIYLHVVSFEGKCRSVNTPYIERLG